MPHTFADIPPEIRRRVAGGEPVALILLDAHEMFVFDPTGFASRFASGPPEETSA